MGGLQGGFVFVLDIFGRASSLARIFLQKSVLSHQRPSEMPPWLNLEGAFAKRASKLEEVLWRGLLPGPFGRG